MKSLLLSVLFVTGIALHCIAQHNYFLPLNLGPQTWSTPPAITIANAAKITMGPTPKNVTVNKTANVDMISGQEIDMLPGFTGGAFLHTGQYVGQIGASSLSIALLTPIPACTFKKIEIGVGVPTGYPTLQQQIDNFTNHPQNPPYPVGMINPYDPTNLSIVATFTATDPHGHKRLFLRDGFYFQDVTVTYPTSANENYLVTDDSLYPFRVRFAPPFSGTWSVTISVTINNSPLLTYSSLPGVFTVNDCGNQGFITTDQYSSNYNVRGNWHFMYDDNNYGTGNNFIPIGENLGGPPTGVPDSINGMPGWNPPLSHFIPSNSDPSVILGGYSMSNDHYDYNLHRKSIAEVANNGGNYVRMLMTMGGYGIESGSPTICDYDPTDSYEMDSTLEQAEEENLFLLLTLEFQPELGYGFLFGAPENWNNPNPNHPGHYWNPYYDYLVNVKGASNPDVYNFFLYPDLIKYFKYRLKYINARWGYSANIFGYELLNEADQVGCSLSKPFSFEYITNPVPLRNAISSWVDTMTNLVHGFYPFHIVTVSYAGGPWYAPDTNSHTDFSPQITDFIEQHEYTHVLPENSDRQSYILDKYFYPNQNYGQNVIEKPRLIGEDGVQCGTVDGVYNSAGGIPINGCADALVRHNDEWSSAFMSSGAGFYWTSSMDLASNMADYKPIGDFFANLSNWGVNFQNTHFSTINQYYSDILSGYGGWQDFYLVDAAAKIDNPNDQSPAQDINLEIGWLSNTEYNWEDNPLNCPLGCGTSQSIIIDPPPVSLFNMQDFSSYKIYVWDPYSDALKGVYVESNTFTHNINFPATLGTIPFSSPYPEPDYAYYCYKTGSHHRVINPDSTEVVTLPNDTVYLPSDSLSLPDSRYFPNLAGTFQWNFGNGISSSKPDSKWLYTTPGEYLLSVNYTELSKKILLKQTYIVLRNDTVKVPNDSIFTLVPNPTNGIFSVFSKGAFSIEEIDVEDVTGRKCFDQTYPKNNLFNITTYAPGIYLVRIKTNEAVVTKKLIKYD